MALIRVDITVLVFHLHIFSYGFFNEIGSLSAVLYTHFWPPSMLDYTMKRTVYNANKMDMNGAMPTPRVENVYLFSTSKF